MIGMSIINSFNQHTKLNVVLFMKICCVVRLNTANILFIIFIALLDHWDKKNDWIGYLY